MRGTLLLAAAAFVVVSETHALQLGSRAPASTALTHARAPCDRRKLMAALAATAFLPLAANAEFDPPPAALAKLIVGDSVKQVEEDAKAAAARKAKAADSADARKERLAEEKAARALAKEELRAKKAAAGK